MNRYIALHNGEILASAVVAIIRCPDITAEEGEKKPDLAAVITGTGQHFVTGRPYSEVLKEWQDAISFDKVVKHLLPQITEFVRGFETLANMSANNLSEVENKRFGQPHYGHESEDDNNAPLCDGDHGEPPCKDPEVLATHL